MLFRSVGGIGPIVAANVLDLSGEKRRGLILGSLMSVEGLGSVAGPAVAGLIIDLSGPRGGLLAIGSVFGLLAVLTLFGFRLRLGSGGAGGSAPAG